MLDLPTMIVLMIAGASAYAWWDAGRNAAERATELGRKACEAAGVLWLDQSVHASSLRFRRREDGWLGLERGFRFDYSEDGIERHAGRLVLFGGKLVSFSGPRRRSPDDLVALSTPQSLTHSNRDGS